MLNDIPTGSRTVLRLSMCICVSGSLRPHGLQHARPLCSSPAPGIYSNSCPLSCWCHPTISSCHPLFLLLSIFPSIRVFSNVSVLCIRWSKYWSFSFSFNPFNEYSGLISIRIDWFDLLTAQGTLKSLLQHQVQKHQFFGLHIIHDVCSIHYT